MAKCLVLTGGGQMIDLMDPNPAHIKLVDIGRSLANMCRYNGHTSRFYSVAEHSLIGCSLVQDDDPALGLAVLLHDSAEAYVGDVITPVKRFSPWVQKAEAQIWLAIRAAFNLDALGVPAFDCEQVAEIDRRLLHAERVLLMPEHPGWVTEPLPKQAKIERLIDSKNYAKDTAQEFCNRVILLAATLKARSG